MDERVYALCGVQHDHEISRCVSQELGSLYNVWTWCSFLVELGWIVPEGCRSRISVGGHDCCQCMARRALTVNNNMDPIPQICCSSL